MHYKVPLKKPAPDATRFTQYLLGQVQEGKPPLIEYLVDEAVMRPILEELLGRAWVPEGSDHASQAAYLDNFIEFWYRMGYDFVRFERGMGFPIPQLMTADTAPDVSKERAWADQHHGLIQSWEDFERYPWPKIEEVDFFRYEYVNAHLPEGMGLIVSHAGGIFEHLSWIMSYEKLCLAVMEQPELVQAMADRIIQLMVQFYNHLLELDRICVLFPGDDMGFHSGTLISPRHLRQFVLHGHKRFATLAHQRGIPYFLHSCGNLEKIYPDLIEEVGIDGKHSFEESILPVQDFQARYGKQVAALGGLDIHHLATGTPAEVRQRTRALIETCGRGGRYAIGSGNSIPSYIPVPNYLAMVDEALL